MWLRWELRHNSWPQEGEVTGQHRYSVRVNPTSSKSPLPKPPPVPTRPEGVTLSPGTIQHDAQGKGVLNWAALTARHIALSASQVLRKLDHSGLSLEDTAAQRGKPSTRARQMPGGGVNPYENRPMPQSRHAPKNSTVIKGAGAARATSRASAPARSSWWQRLFRRG